MNASSDESAQVRIVQSRKPSNLEIRKSIYSFRQVIAGKSSGPREVRKLMERQSVFRRISEFDAHKFIGGLWVQENEELLIRLLNSKIAARKLFIGPNIASENPKLSKLVLRSQFSKVIVPSWSMREILLERQLGYLPSQILIWFAGVNHEYWKPDEKVNKDLILVYQKGPESEYRVKAVETTLKKLNLPFVTIKYGQYRQRHYLSLLNESKFVIWVGHTETQGIAQFQAWSMNTPTLVSGLPKKRLNERDGFLASASPYLSKSTGLLAQGEQPSGEEILQMNKSLDSFSPRLWVRENATQELAVEKLVKIFHDELTN